MVRTASTMIALLLFASIALAAKPRTQHVVLKGRFVVPEAESEGAVVFKTASKSFTVDLNKVYLQKHRVQKLKKIPSGTKMFVFAKYTEWADGDEYERMACLVAGEHYAPKHVQVNENLASWHTGTLRFVSNKSIAYVGAGTLPTGVDRPTCVIEKASFADFFQTKKSGKKKAKAAYIRGAYVAKKVDGKNKMVFVPHVITLPTRGIPAKEYGYILDPVKMYKELGG